MNDMTHRIVAATALLAWAAVVALLHRRWRRAPWLASSSVATLAMPAGVAVIAASFVPYANALLAPLWLAFGVLAVAHLRAAAAAANRRVLDVEHLRVVEAEHRAAEAPPANFI